MNKPIFYNLCQIIKQNLNPGHPLIFYRLCHDNKNFFYNMSDENWTFNSYYKNYKYLELIVEKNKTNWHMICYYDVEKIDYLFFQKLIIRMIQCKIIDNNETELIYLGFDEQQAKTWHSLIQLSI